MYSKTATPEQEGPRTATHKLHFPALHRRGTCWCRRRGNARIVAYLKPFDWCRCNITLSFATRLAPRMAIAIAPIYTASSTMSCPIFLIYLAGKLAFVLEDGQVRLCCDFYRTNPPLICRINPASTYWMGNSSDIKCGTSTCLD